MLYISISTCYILKPFTLYGLNFKNDILILVQLCTNINIKY